MRRLPAASAMPECLSGLGLADMCLGIPFQIAEAGAFGRARGVTCTGEERVVQTLLLDLEPAVGDWVLVHIDTAVALLDTDEAAEINATLAELGAAMERNGALPLETEPPAPAPEATEYNLG